MLIWPFKYAPYIFQCKLIDVHSLCVQTGGTEEVYKEQKRQQELENNYKFVWGEKQEESQSTGNSESDEADF